MLSKNFELRTLNPELFRLTFPHGAHRNGKKLSRRYGRRRGIEGVSLSVSEGARLAIVREGEIVADESLANLRRRAGHKVTIRCWVLMRTADHLVRRPFSLA